jgi:hypothetical protein
VRESNAFEVEQRIEELCGVFEAERSYLDQYWSDTSRKEKNYARAN